MKLKKKIINQLEFFGFRILIFIFKLLPFKLSRSFLANVASFIAFHFNIRRDLAFTEIKNSFPNYSDKKINNIIKEMYKNLGKMAAEMYFIEVEKLFPEIEAENFEYLQEAYNHDKGVVFASGHFGNWENSGQYIASKGIKISAIIKKQRNPLFDKYTRELRTKLGVNLIYSRGVLKSIVSALRDKQMIALMIDQDAKKNGLLLPFLGREASTFTGPARFAIKLNSPIVFGITLRNPDDSLKIIFDKPIYPQDFAEHENAIEEITKMLNSRLEYYVRKYPSQWFWVHNRWKYTNKMRKSGEL